MLTYCTFLNNTFIIFIINYYHYFVQELDIIFFCTRVSWENQRYVQWKSSLRFDCVKIFALSCSSWFGTILRTENAIYTSNSFEREPKSWRIWCLVFWKCLTNLRDNTWNCCRYSTTPIQSTPIQDEEV